MPDSKHAKWVDEFRENESSTGSPNDAVTANQPAANDSDGWQQYRRWISKAPAPKERRVGIDPSLYTWKGYRNWTEQIKRDWESDDDSE